MRNEPRRMVRRPGTPESMGMPRKRHAEWLRRYEAKYGEVSFVGLRVGEYMILPADRNADLKKRLRSHALNYAARHGMTFETRDHDGEIYVFRVDDDIRLSRTQGVKPRVLEDHNERRRS